VIELTAAYLDFAESYYIKDGRQTDHMGTVRRAIKAVNEPYGRSPAAEVGPLAFWAVQQRLIVADHTRSTINSTCDTIRRMFQWAASQEMIPVTVYQALATVPGLRKGHTAAREPAPIMPVDDQVVDATLPTMPPVIASMVRFQRLTGCRPGEACQVRPMDLDRSREVWEYRPASHKTEHYGRERVIFVGPKAQDVLLPYLHREPAAYCFSPAESEAKRHEQQRVDQAASVGHRGGGARRPLPNSTAVAA
jgi:integrase